jgi:hypothetical protein
MADKKNLSEGKREKEPLSSKAKEIFHKRMEKDSKSSGGMMPKETQELLYELQVNQIELEMQNEEMEHTQEELFYAKERYLELYNMAPVGYLTLSEDYVILEANLTAATMLGTTWKNLIGKPITNFILSEDQDVCYLYRKRLSENTPEPCELRMRAKEGRSFWAELNAVATQDSEGKPIFRMVINDVTARKKMEEKLHLKEKMILVQSRQAAMGEMISMIAHQWRQPLNIVGLAIANIETKQMLELLDKAALEENLSVINKNIAFMSDTIDDFRNFFRPDKPKEWTSVEQVISSTVDIIGKNLEHNNIDVRLHSSSKSVLFISKNSLLQVLLNLLSNARDALVSKDKTDAVICIDISENEEEIVTSICDNAGGIPDAVMEKIGQPYFTTKELNGTGLGIYMSKIVVEKHLNGTLIWHNDAKGACFVITLRRDKSKQG